MPDAVAMEFASEQPVYSTPYLLDPVFRLSGALSAATRVLDVGCGNGYWAGCYARKGCQVVGIDPSSTGIEIARQQYPQGRFEQIEIGADLLARLEEPAFDVIVSTEVVEHLYDPVTFARACFDALGSGGRLVISTPYHGWLKNCALAATGKLDPHHEALRVGGHIKFFSKRTLQQLLLDAGFRQLEFVGAGRVRWMWKSMVMAATKP